MSQASEQTVSVLDQFLNKSIEYLSSAEAFLKAEVPAFIQEFMAWKFYESLFIIIVSILFLTLSVYIGKKAIKCNAIYKAKDRCNNDSNDLITLVFFCAIGLLASSGLIISKTHTIIKIKVAPRVFLLEEVRQLIK